MGVMDIRYMPNPPPPDSALAYNEDEIVGLITEIYAILISLCYFKLEDLIFPPADTGRHTLTNPLVQELQLSPRVVSLLERIPYCTIVNFNRPNWYPESFPLNYFKDEDFRLGRDPIFRGTQDENIRNLRPQDVTLSTHFGREGRALILDTEANSLRIINGPSTPEENVRWNHNVVYELPDDEFSYRNFPGYHAPSVLRDYRDRLRSLSLVPNPRDGEIDGSSLLVYGGEEVRSVLKNEYGWPDNFRVDDWAREYEQVWEDASDRGIERMESLSSAETDRLILGYGAVI